MKRGRALAGLVLSAVAACGSPSQIVLGSQQAQVRVELSPFRVHVLDASGKELLTTLGQGGPDAYGSPAVTVDPGTVSGQLLPGWDGFQDGPMTWPHAGKAKLVAATATSATVVLDAGGDSVEIDLSVDGERVRWSQIGTMGDSSVSPRTVASTASFELPADEHFFGMGERFATSDHRGWSLYSWAEEGGLGGGETTPPSASNPYPNGPSMTYFPVPFFVSTRGYGLRLDTTYRSVLCFGSERADAWRLFVNHPSFSMTIYVSADPLEVIRAHTEDTGRPVVPAPWVFGVHRRIDLGGTVNGVPEWQLMRQMNIPITGIDDATHFLPASDQVGREFELVQWVDTLHANGFKAFAYNNPYVSASVPGGAVDYAYGVANGYFVKGPDGNPSLTTFSSAGLQKVAAVDFTNPAATAWFQGLLARTLAVGYDGWMHDFGEYTARDAVFFDGRRGDEMHNLYPVLSAHAAAELLAREQPDSVFFVRSGYFGTQQYAPVTWGGDAEADFDDTQGLPSAVRGGLNLSASGMPYWGSDVTGYKCLDSVPHDKEMFIRWTELAAVSPWWKEENACANPLQSQTKWTLWSDAETTATYAKWASLHTRLQPYFLALAQQAAATGAPITQLAVLRYPADPETWGVDDAFFVGPSLYAAPVVRRGQTWKDTWLPPGRVVDLDDYSVYVGGTEGDIPAPLDKLPLFLIENQLVPMLDPSVQTLAPATVPSVVTAQAVADRLDVVVALAVGGSAQMTLADGTTLVASRGTTDAGNPGNLQAADATTIPACSLCYLESSVGDVDRLQANTATSTSSEIQIADLDLRVQGGPARRIRWDALRLR